MKEFAAGLGIGIFGGGALSYLFAAKVINDYKKAAQAVGTFFSKVEGKIVAVKRAI